MVGEEDTGERGETEEGIPVFHKHIKEEIEVGRPCSKSSQEHRKHTLEPGCDFP